MKIPFSLPAPAGCSDSPKWDGQAFVFDGQRTPVLEYSENFAGWSDDLTALHEEAAGDSHPIDLASRRYAIEQLRHVLPASNAVVMEIGCSSGFLIKDIVKSFPDVSVVGADVVKAPLYKLASDMPGVPLIRFDLLKCPLPDQSVDVLIMLNVLEHIEDDVGALRNAWKLLKPGGALVIEVPAGPSLYDAYDAELQHFRRYSAKELNRKLSAAGFRVHRKSHLGFVLYPAFVVVKLINKWMSVKRKATVVRDQATSTSSSTLVSLGMKIESNYLANFELPFGIRALAVARRPESLP
jgi:SAM-dependent methyltransferase